MLPAHDYVLKCSHTFNVLDTRGAVGVTERQAMFARMRDLSRRVAEAYLAQREHLEYPVVGRAERAAEQCGDRAVDGNRGWQQDRLTSCTSRSRAAHFLLEIGTEELPAGDLESALAQLRERVPGWLDELRLAHGEVQVVGTPRRLVVSVADLAPRQADRTAVVKGPPAARAFDAMGLPTKAAEGFARSRGLAVEDLQVREMDGGQYAGRRGPRSWAAGDRRPGGSAAGADCRPAL